MFEKDGFCLRPPVKEDAEPYYKNFDPLDGEAAYLTGSKACFSKAEVVGFFLKCLTDDTRQDFLLTAPDGQIIGEAVVNEIDWPTKTANFRLAIFRPEYRNKGLGTWMVNRVCGHAFREMGLAELTLEVFSFNPRAKHVYEKAGFRVREAEGEEIIMALAKEDFCG